MAKFLNIVSCYCVFFMFSNGLVHAERTCTRTVINSDGSKTTIASCSTQLTQGQRDCTQTIVESGGNLNITVDCSSSFTKDKNPDIVRNTDRLKYLENNVFEKTNDNIRALKDRTANHARPENNSDEKAAEIRKKAQEVVDTVRLKQQEQKYKY